MPLLVHIYGWHFRHNSHHTLGHHALAHQPEALGHLTQMEELLHPAQFTLFKSLSVKFIKIELREREIWCNLSKFSYLLVFDT